MRSSLRAFALFFLMIAAGLVLGSSSAQAIVDIEGGYSILNATPGQVNSYGSSVKSASGLSKESGFSGDIRLTLPLMPFGLGVRYEDWTRKATGNTNSIDSSFKRVSLIVEHRFIDTILYLGVLSTIGLSNKFKYTVQNDQTYTASGSVTGSVGVEGGVILGFLTVGAELGYLIAPLSDLKQSNGQDASNNGSSVKVNMSGGYGRITMGLNI